MPVLLAMCMRLFAFASLIHTRSRSGSGRRCLWECHKCKCGQSHEWETTVRHRALQGNDCPVCAHLRPCRYRACTVYTATCRKQDFGRAHSMPPGCCLKSVYIMYMRAVVIIGESDQIISTCSLLVCQALMMPSCDVEMGRVCIA